MKIIVCILILLSSYSWGQAPAEKPDVISVSYIGFNAGASISSCTSCNFFRETAFRSHFGLSYKKYLFTNYNWLLKTNINYNQRGFRVKFFDPTVGNLDLKFRSDHVDLNSTISKRIVNNLFVGLGGSFSVLLSQSGIEEINNSNFDWDGPGTMEFGPILNVFYTHKKFDYHLNYYFGTWSREGYWTVRFTSLIIGASYYL